MFPTVDDPSAAGAGAGGIVSSSFPDADAYDNGDSDDIDFPVDPNPNPNAAFSAATAAAPASAAASAGGGERRPLFQRLWTDEDEIVILRAFAEFTAQRGTAFASHQYDTTPFYEDMRQRLQMGFTKSQLVEKLRRLKRKYRNCVDRLRISGANFSFRSPHEQAIFEIARTIWRPASDKHGRDSDDEGNGNDALAIDAAAAAAAGANANGEVKSPSSRPRRGRRRRTGDVPADAGEALALPPAPMPVMTQEALPSFPQTAMDGSISMDPAGLPAALSAAAAAVTDTTENSILAPLFKEMVRAMLSISSSTAPLPGLEPPPAIAGVRMEGEKWRQQRILELEVYLRRIDLLQDQARAALEELRSASQAGGMNT
ncbi:probable transcription factor At5g28040 [Phragmites australis]|uniref:probable transcription factor At5g28040 n=1 Tax=Phragmites australis TaxID=29695 RepID=UPI002D7A2AEE|nr:probable transcription factor At5g28040 [Phragmites australis]